jgi:hypothetical protein
MSCSNPALVPGSSDLQSEATRTKLTSGAPLCLGVVSAIARTIATIVD